MLYRFKQALNSKQKEIIGNLLYLPFVLRGVVICFIWGIRRPRGLRLRGMPIIWQSRRGSIKIGDSFTAVSKQQYNSIGLIQPVVIKALGVNTTIEIGNNVGMSGSTLSARSSIKIGNGVLLGSGVLISDNDAHPLRSEDRNDPSKTLIAPVVIEDLVFVGARAIILKGVTLGVGCVVGAGSVVSKNVPPYTLVAGNPAQAIRNL
jgi:acetyltransferase-like isoleucine patch superfamily enzyme